MPSDANILDRGSHLGNLVLGRVTKIRANRLWRAQHQLNSILFFAKAFKTYTALRLLWRRGFREDAGALARSLFELSLQTVTAGKDPKASVSLLQDHDVFTRYIRYRDAKRIQDTEVIKLFATRRVELRKLQRHFYRVQKRRPKFRKGLGWWSGSVRDLAKMVDGSGGNEGHERYYVHLYSDQSDIVHSGPSAFKKYVREAGGNLVVNARPSTASTGDLTDSVPRFATWFLCEVSAGVDAAFELGIQERINRLKALVAS